MEHTIPAQEISGVQAVSSKNLLAGLPDQPSYTLYFAHSFNP
jgi:hypothetical protein